MTDKKLIQKIHAFNVIGESSTIEYLNENIYDEFAESLVRFIFNIPLNKKLTIDENLKATPKKIKKIALMIDKLIILGHLEVNHDAKYTNELFAVSKSGFLFAQQADNTLKEKMFNVLSGLVGILLGALIPLLVKFLETLF